MEIPGSPQRKSALKKVEGKSPETKKARMEGEGFVSAEEKDRDMVPSWSLGGAGSAAASAIGGAGSPAVGSLPNGGLLGVGSGVGTVPPFLFGGGFGSSGAGQFANSLREIFFSVAHVTRVVM